VTFRARIILVAAAAVALAVVVASAVVYVVVRDQLLGSVDDGLRETAGQIAQSPPRDLGRFTAPRPDPESAGGYPQLVTADGQVFLPPGSRVKLPVDDRVLDVAAGRADEHLTDAEVDDVHVRLLARPYFEGVAVEVSRPLTEVDHSLDRIKLFLLLIAGLGVAVAAGLGYLVSRAAVAPVTRLTVATEHVSETGDLSGRIETTGEDELGRLASSFNTMLAALEDSTRAQRQLVADASHELRTPLTSLRTNIEVLASERELAPDERRRLLSDVVDQLGEMTTLSAELIELARGAQHPSEPEDVRLDLVTEAAVERMRRDRPGVEVTLSAAETTVHGVPSSLERAIGNLLDNAAKWSPPGGSVEVRVGDGEVTVRDHGPGIDEADRPYVFDRFYRAPGARGQPGSGLGLAIVKQVAETHGGTVTAEPAEGGGTQMRLRLNGRAPAGDS
jgi:two-component system, OmpR family, sensor histidine kinase MprB